MALGTDTSTAEEDGFSSVSKVLEIAELLDNILSFLWVDDLLRARQVSNFWRSTAQLTLRQRLVAVEKFGSTFKLVFRYSEAKVRKPLQLDIPPKPIPSSLTSNVEILVGNEAAFVPHKPSPALSPMLSTLLTFDWASRIQRLNLKSDAVTVQEWNSMSLYLLSVMTSLRRLKLSVASQLARSGDWDDVPAVEATSVVSNLETVEIRYWHFEDENFRPTKGLLDLGFLEVCPNLQSFDVHFVYAERQHFESLKFFPRYFDWSCLDPISSKRPPMFSLKFKGSLVSANGISCDLEVSDGTDFEAGDHRILELNSLLTFLKPKSLHFESANNYLAYISVEATCNLKTLIVTVPDGASSVSIVSNLVDNMTAFNGIERFRILNFNFDDVKLYSAETFPKLADIGLEQLLPNLTSLNITAEEECQSHRETSKSVLQKPIVLMPNMQFLTVLSDYNCDCFLEHAHKFPWLRHLVIVIELHSEYRSRAHKYKDQLRKIQGLQTLTLLLKIKYPKNIYFSGIKNLLETLALAVPSLRIVRILYLPAHHCYFTLENVVARIREIEEMVKRCRAKFGCKWKLEFGPMKEYPSLETLDACLHSNTL